MKVTTTFDVGDQVWHLWDKPHREIERCSVCDGAGKVNVVGSEALINCPKCWGRGELESGEQYTQHLVSADPMTIGLVRVVVEGPSDGTSRATDAVDVSNMGPRSYKRTEEYMCVETGVGSGRIYKLADLFRSREEAEAAARARTSASADSIQRYDAIREVPVS